METDRLMIVGLGNPGKEYEDTRHNAGFWVVDRIARTLAIEVKDRKFGARFGSGVYKGKKLILLKPWQYMNRSGQAVVTAAGFYKMKPEDILVISDDIALDVGKIRLRKKGSAGGQKGLADVLQKLGTQQVSRLRIGVGDPGRWDAADYVLARPSKEEKGLLDDAVARACEAVFCWIEDGIDKAMNEFNADLQSE